MKSSNKIVNMDIFTLAQIKTLSRYQSYAFTIILPIYVKYRMVYYINGFCCMYFIFDSLGYNVFTLTEV